MGGRAHEWLSEQGFPFFIYHAFFAAHAVPGGSRTRMLRLSWPYRGRVSRYLPREDSSQLGSTELHRCGEISVVIQYLHPCARKELIHGQPGQVAMNVGAPYCNETIERQNAPVRVLN